MPLSLVDSQVATLEQPQPEENVLTIDGAADPGRCVDLVMGFLSHFGGSPRNTHEIHF